MSSKYDAYWENRLDAILQLFDQARTSGTSEALALTDLNALSKRGSWHGTLKIVAGQSVYHKGAHLAALGALLTPRLPEWSREHAWIVTVGDDLQLTVEKTELQQTNWLRTPIGRPNSRRRSSTPRFTWGH